MLPPSFLQTSKHGAGEWPNYAKIDYGVLARLVWPGIGVVNRNIMENLTVSVPVLFVPQSHSRDALELPGNLLRYSEEYTLQSLALTGQNVDWMDSARAFAIAFHPAHEDSDSKQSSSYPVG